MIYDWRPEAYTEFGLSFLFVGLRVFSRTKIFGVKGWQGDDYLILLALALYCSMAGLWPTVWALGTIHQSPNMPPDQRKAFIKGLKANQAIWGVYVFFLWALKACMLFLYGRLTAALPQRHLVKIGWYIMAVTFIVSILEVNLHCLPLHRIWDIDTQQGRFCSTSLLNFYVVGLSNILTDFYLLFIPLPLVVRSRLPLKRKLMITALLGSGVLIIAATLIRNIAGLMQIHGGGNLNRKLVLQWAMRENLIAMVIVNVPCIKPLFSSQSWFSSSPAPRPDPGSSSSGSDYTGPRGSVATRRANSAGILYKEEITFDGKSIDMELDKIDIENGKEEEIAASRSQQGSKMNQMTNA